jgi:hypothetical protein
MEVDVDSDRGQGGGDLLSVRVGDLPEQQFGADGDDLRVQPEAPRRCPTRSAPSLPVIMTGT